MRRLVVLFVLLISLVLAASAQAAVTSSSITTPSDPFYGLDHGQTQNVTVSGTSNGTTGDHVDIVCYQDNGSTSNRSHTIASNVSVQSGGSFSTSVPIHNFYDYSVDPCRLRAVPSGTPPTSGLSSFHGPRAIVAFLDRITSSSQLYDYYFYAPGLAAGSDPLSFGDCGLDDSYLWDPTVFGQNDVAGFYCNDYVSTSAASNSSRSGLEVSGHPAYAPAMEKVSTPGFQPLVINSVSQNTSNGNLTLVETEPIVRCISDASYGSSCPSYVSAGVQLKRRITQTDNGHIVYFRDAWSSTDAGTHSVNLLLENDQFFADSTLSYKFPGQSTYATHTSGDHVSVPSRAPASALVEGVGSSGPVAYGAITYAQAPSGSFAFASDKVFDAPNAFTVTSSKGASVGYAYSTDYAQAAVQKEALIAQDAFSPPSIKVTSPKNHSKVKTKHVTVKGVVSAGSGVKSVTVNGHKAKVSGGKFSVTVRLHSGRNRLKVKLTSEAGGVATKTITVTVAAAKKKTHKPSPTFTG